MATSTAKPKRSYNKVVAENITATKTTQHVDTNNNTLTLILQLLTQLVGNMNQNTNQANFPGNSRNKIASKKPKYT
jgi:hypothetical protein